MYKYRYRNVQVDQIRITWLEQTSQLLVFGRFAARIVHGVHRSSHLTTGKLVSWSVNLPSRFPSVFWDVHQILLIILVTFFFFRLCWKILEKNEMLWNLRFKPDYVHPFMNIDVSVVPESVWAPKDH